MIMPKYYYKCKKCDHSFKAYHGMKEKLDDCPQCKTVDGLVREVNKIFIKKEKIVNSNNNIGDLTNQFIEDNRTILKDYKEELLQNEHDDTNISD